MMNTQCYYKKQKTITDYPNFIYAQQKLSVEKLKSQCYTDNQIITIHTFNGDESLIPLAFATVSATFSGTKFKYYSSSNRIYLAIKLIGKWSESPLIRFQDTITFNTGFGIDFSGKDISGCGISFGI